MLISENIRIDGRNRNEYADDALDILRRRKVTFRGCKPEYIELKLDGSVKVEFVGYRDGKPWKGTFQFACPFSYDRIILSDPAAIADICAKGIQLMDAD